MVSEKYCPRCKTIKKASEFSIQRKEACGLYYICRECRKPESSKYLENLTEDKKEKIKERKKELRPFWKWKRKNAKDLRDDMELYFSMKYENIKRRCLDKSKKTYLGREFNINKKDFLNKILKDEKAKKIYCEWLENNYEFKKTPSVDRINNNVGYVIENIQVLTMEENTKKRYLIDYA